MIPLFSSAVVEPDLAKQTENFTSYFAKEKKKRKTIILQEQVDQQSSTGR